MRSLAPWISILKLSRLARIRTAQDLARGRISEIEHLNGYVVQRGAALGVPTPVNHTLLVLVRMLQTPPGA